jgi:hypothetical protein
MEQLTSEPGPNQVISNKTGLGKNFQERVDLRKGVEDSSNNILG